jgi:iron(III) transport system permease protein
MKSRGLSWLILPAIIMVFLGVFLVYPLAAMLVRAIHVDGAFTAAFFFSLFKNQGLREAMVNSLLVGVYSTVLTTMLALPMAWIFVRYSFPGKSILNGLVLVPMIMPPFVGALGLKYVFARYGALNILLDQHLGLPTIDWFSAGGMAGVVVLEVLHLYPIMFLNVSAALANVDPAMEEAGANLGASAWRVFRRITFPLMLPGYFAGAVIVFIWSFTDPGGPLIFEYRNCIPVQIFDHLTDMNENPVGYALVVFVMLVTLLFFVGSKWIAQRRQVISSGKGATVKTDRRPSRLALAGIYTFLIALTSVALLPHISVLGVAVSDKWFMTVFPEEFTLRYFKLAVTHRLAVSSIRNSLFLSTCATLIDVVLGVILGYLFVRRRGRLLGWLDTLVMMPMAVPGIVLGFGYVSCFSGIDLGPFTLDPRVNPFPLLIICYSVRRLPYVVRSAYAGFQQLSETLEEAGRNLGARSSYVVRRITSPLMSSHVLAGGILAFSFAMFEVGSTLVLAFKEEHYPIAKAIYMLNMRLTDGPNIASAMGILGMILLAVSLVIVGTILGQRMGELFRSR